MSLATRPRLSLFNLPACFRPMVVSRLYATQTGLGTTSTTPKPPPRRAVSVFNDDGRVPWGQLSPAEKVARTTQQSVNGGMILLGVVLTSGVAYFMWTEVFSPDSKVTHFNRAVTQIKQDPRCVELLGESSQISAYGERSWSKWTRNRPIASNVHEDSSGTQHLVMHFYAEGPKAKGVVNLHMIKKYSEHEFVYKYLALDVPGHQRLYLENADTSLGGIKSGVTKMFGVQWTR